MERGGRFWPRFCVWHFFSGRSRVPCVGDERAIRGLPTSGAAAEYPWHAVYTEATAGAAGKSRQVPSRAYRSWSRTCRIRMGARLPLNSGRALALVVLFRACSSSAAAYEYRANRAGGSVSNPPDKHYTRNSGDEVAGMAVHVRFIKECAIHWRATQGDADGDIRQDAYGGWY